MSLISDEELEAHGIIRVPGEETEYEKQVIRELEEKKLRDFDRMLESMRRIKEHNIEDDDIPF